MAAEVARQPNDTLDVIVVDHGLASGTTAGAALRSVRRRGPATLILAVPDGARDPCLALAEDPEVQAILADAHQAPTIPPA